MKPDVGNIFSGIPKQIPEELFQTILSQGQLKVERIISKGQSTPVEKWYDQIQDEWIILLKGKAKLQLKKGLSLICLTPGDYYFIPAHTQHRVHWTTPDMETIWLAIHIYPLQSIHE